MSRNKSIRDSKKGLLTSLPWELLLLIMEFVDLGDLRAMTMTCSSMSTALDSMLYKCAIFTDVHVQKFAHAAIWGRTTVISKFLKAGVSMIEFEGYTLPCREQWIFHLKDYRWMDDTMNTKILKGLHPLLAASIFGHVDVVRTLIIEGNMDVDFEDASKKTALLYAIQLNHLDVVKILLEYGAKLTM